MSKLREELVLKAIQDGNTKEAIRVLKKLELSEEKGRALSIIEAEFNTLNREIIKGTIDGEQRQLRFNRIHDKLLTLLYTEDKLTIGKGLKSKFLLWLIPILMIFLFILYSVINTQAFQCPEFNNTSKNKILLIPFENVGKEPSKPHILLRDRIEELSIKKKVVYYHKNR